MTFVREQEIKIDGKDIFVIDVINYENEQYLYTQEIVNDELVDNYMIYKYDSQSNAMIYIKDSAKLDILANLFKESINKLIEN